MLRRYPNARTTRDLDLLAPHDSLSDSINVDVVVSREPRGEPTVRQLEACIPGTPITEWPMITLYPVADHVADKLAALYELHGTPPSKASTRFRDLVDLLLIAQREPLDGIELHAALRSEVDRRRALGTAIALPERFTVPTLKTWTSGYAKAAKGVVGLERYSTLRTATDLADRFITPLLDAHPPGRWDPQHLTWASGLEERATVPG